MSEYKRLVSYLFAYNKGIKDKNVGFVKAECKNGLIKLWVSFKWAAAQAEELCVHFFVRREDMIVGLEIGRVRLENGNGEYKGSCGEQELPVSFGEICGIYIKGMESLFVSQWDDLEFNADKLIDIRDYQRNMEEYQETAENSKEQVEDAQMAERQESEQQKTEPQLNIWEMPIKESIYVQELQSNYENQEEWTEAIAGEETEDEEIEEAEMENIVEVENENRNSWDELFESRTKVDLFSDDDIYDCVEIAPQDILMLPQEAGRMMTNSFLNHGFFNFRHLILGKKYNEEGKPRLIVGVPGVYNRREKMTANMFGFEKFKFSMRSDVRMNHFGYWYKEF